MSGRPRRAARTAPPEAKPRVDADETAAPAAIPRRTLVLIVAFLLLGHYGLAASSLVRENPTVDEANHLPAGISYWQTGSFRLYHHNPPLIKMIAAVPILTDVAPFGQVFKQAPIWNQDSIPPAGFGTAFCLSFATQYFELFSRSRLLMLLF